MYSDFFSLPGLCGGSASGKTTVANRIIEALDVPWVSLLSLDSFYKVLTVCPHSVIVNALDIKTESLEERVLRVDENSRLPGF